MYKRYFMLLLPVLCILLLSCGRKGERGAKSFFPDSIVDAETIATINDYSIKGREVKLFAAVFMQRNQQGLPAKEYNVGLLEKLIDRILIWQEAVANGVSIDESESRAIIGRFVAAMGGEEVIKNFLEAHGFERDELIHSLKRDLVIRQFLEDRFAKRIEIGESDAREYFDQHPDQFITPDSVRARHILVRVEQGDDEGMKQQKWEKLRGVLARARKGEDFGELARLYSEDPTSSSKGGDLGTFSRGSMVAAFDSAAFALEPGEVSGIVESRFGYHIIKVEERKAGRKVSFEEIKDRLISSMREFELADEVENHLQDLRQVARIERHYQ